MARRWIARVEGAVKRALFGCRGCGQCLLSQTSLVCPMTCPKGLRQGPCGGTLDGMCEVVPTRRCTWVRIHERETASWSSKAGLMPLHAPADPSLFGTPSVLNRLTGADRATRRPLPFPASPATCDPGPPPAASRLARKLRGGRQAVTCEIRTPRTSKGMARASAEIDALAQVADALNATSGHGGAPTIPPLEVLRMISGRCEAIPQVCGRDVDPAAFLDRLCEIREAGIPNVLCLTGDWIGPPPADGAAPEEARRGFFGMDAAQMIYEARYLREKGCSAFADLRGRPAPSLFVGAAINPASAPREAVLSRLAQKIACGAGFLQTQLVADAAAYAGWLGAAAEAGLLERAYVLASVPLVGSRGGLAALERLPGVRLPGPVRERLHGAGDLAAEGLALARELSAELLRTGVHGIHLMGFGADPARFAEAASFCAARAGRFGAEALAEARA